MYREYLAEPSDPPWQQLLLPSPGVSVGCLVDGRVTGVAYGRPSPRKTGSITLRGIAVQSQWAKRGHGSRLLGFFEARVRERGYDVVGLASAGGYVDHFYEKNGYRCVGYLVGLSETQVDLAKAMQRFTEFVEPADSDRYVIINTESMSEETRRQVLTDLEGAELNALMNKVIADSR